MFIPQRKNALDNQAIKQAIMNYGAVSASYLSVDEYYSNDQISFCLPDDYDAGRLLPVLHLSYPHNMLLLL